MLAPAALDCGMRRFRVLVIGGYGLFGGRLVERLARVPTMASAALVQKLATGALTVVGATPCIGLLSLDDFAEAATGLRITATITAR